jgi:membrane protease YdiL (CAAX protease family)
MIPGRPLRAARDAGRTIARTAGWLLLWLLPGGVGLLLRPIPSLLGSVASAAAPLLYAALGRPRARLRRAASLHLRPIGPALPWILAAGPVFGMLSTVLTFAYEAIVPGAAPPQVDYAFLSLPLGGLVLPASAIVAAPMAEEFALRGYLQARLARRWGHPLAIAVSTACFAIVHASSSWLPCFAVGGLVLGCTFAATRSLWACVLLHALVNTWQLLIAPGLPLDWLGTAGHPTRLLLLAALALALALLLVGARGSRRRARAGTGRARLRGHARRRRSARDRRAGRIDGTPKWRDGSCRSAHARR